MQQKNHQTLVYFISLGAFALGMASYVTAGLIPLIGQSFSIPVAIAAQLVTAFTLAYGLGSPLVVAILPAGRQREGLLWSLALFVCANAASALAANMTMLLIFRALAGIGAGVYLATGIATAAALSGANARGKSIAILMGGMASGTVLGVPLSLIVANRAGWQSALWLIAGLGLITLIGLWRKLPPVFPATAEVSISRKLSILRDRNVSAILLVSFLAAIASLGMYTFMAPFMMSYPDVRSVVPWLWLWGVGGILGSVLIGALTNRIGGPTLTLAIMGILTLSLFAMPIVMQWSLWLMIIPVTLWGMVGWALQVPQNHELIRVRENTGDGNLAVALNESALYLGSAVGASAGGLILSFNLDVFLLPIIAAGLAFIGMLIQIGIRKKSAPDALY
ncbi:MULTISPECIES: MFS transporter [unclassified Brenneria]|uniref:MFS transporter n=1 Tax=unclassified Brenneria TaxID=2634434 RepID=UPI0029C258AC|nr:MULTISPECIES: MFS transporter [unclassified Brenneria]MDX5627002.1 MFS transporter [Brenneria sp. L3-3Z]MDX5693648.1 MFS transporter [Brenneria sp. L4-2C]MEE3661712.1 MFS transporter [Brenneria sp. g21c3]